MNRYYVHDRKVYPEQTFGYRDGDRWAIVDRKSGKTVDEGATRYEATQVARALNATASARPGA